MMLTRYTILALALLCTAGCDRTPDSSDFGESGRPDAPEDPRPPPEKLELVDSFEIGGFTYGIDSVERSDVHERFEDQKTGEMDWVTIHYRMVNTSDEPMAPVVPDVLVETNGLSFRDTGGNAQIGAEAVEKTGVSIGQLDQVSPGETELNMAIFKIPDPYVDDITATFDFDGYQVSPGKPLEYVFELQPRPGTQVLSEPIGDAGQHEGAGAESPNSDAGD